MTLSAPRVGAGYVGHFQSLASLAAKCNPLDYAGRSATVEFQLNGNTAVATYTCNGQYWWQEQDPANVAITGGTIGGETIVRTAGLTKKLRKTSLKATDLYSPSTYKQAPNAWTANATYKQGEVVSNGGNWYQCIVAGTAAASGGPSGTGAAQITDNTAKWYYFSPALVSSTALDTPTLSVQAGGTVSGLSNLFAAVGNQGTVFKCLDSLYYETSGSNLNAQNGVIASGNTQASYGCWEFMSDAPKIAIKTSDYVSTLRLLVNDVSVTVGDYPLGAPSTNADYWTILDFGGVRRERKITVLGTGSLRGVSVDSLSDVWGAPTQLVRALWIGDSYGAGSAGGPARALDHYPNMIAKFLGIGQGLIDFSAGGSGWLNPGNGGAYNYLDRMNATATQLQAASLDFVFLEGTNNDSSFTDAQLSAQYLAVMQRVRVLQPNALIVVTGPWVGSIPTIAARINTLLKAAFTLWGDPYSLYLPTLSDTPEGVSWLSGTGNVGSPSGTGNNDVYLYTDGTHLTVKGQYYMARRASDALQTLLNV